MNDFSHLKNKLLAEQIEDQIYHYILDTPQIIESVARMAPKRVVYVSCNPETMARDLALLTKKGYRAEGFTPVDMFPTSEHIEVVCALSRQEHRKQSRR